jgi:hypothetical protein
LIFEEVAIGDHCSPSAAYIQAIQQDALAPILDLLPELEKGDYLERDVHLNRRGTEKVARRMLNEWMEYSSRDGA